LKKKLHAKQKGIIGETAVYGDFIARGYTVWVDLSDLSRVDMLAFDEDGTGNIYKVQVKYVTAKDGVATVRAIKSGPGYKYKYKETDVDLFALYCPDIKSIAYISSKQLCAQKAAMNFRIQKPANSGFKQYHNFYSYTFESALEFSLTGKIPAETEEDYNKLLPAIYKNIKSSIKKKPKIKKPRPTKIDWPSDSKLKEMVDSMPMVKVGKLLGVSDNAVRKRLKTRGLLQS
jgi:hypothetical protein